MRLAARKAQRAATRALRLRSLASPPARSPVRSNRPLPANLANSSGLPDGRKEACQAGEPLGRAAKLERCGGRRRRRDERVVPLTGGRQLLIAAPPSLDAADGGSGSGQSRPATSGLWAAHLCRPAERRQRIVGPTFFH